MKKTKIATVTLGHYVYFTQFEGLREELIQKGVEFSSYLDSDDCDIFDAGFVECVDDAFEAVKRIRREDPDLLFIIEIKNSGDSGYEACRILDEVLDSYPEYRDNIVVGSFHPEIEEHLENEYPEIMRGASTKGAAIFVLTHFAGVNIFDTSSFACLQVPMEYDLGITVKLDLASIIGRAHKRGVAVQYWTINDEDEMRHLIDLGCDCIMTDDPALMRQVIDEYEAESK